MMDREIIFEKVYSKTRKFVLKMKFVLHFLHRDGKIFKTTFRCLISERVF